jgi:hypothetical protein
MILFCEECGEKNQISFDKINNGRIVFCCGSCQFLNDLAVDQRPKEEKVKKHPKIKINNVQFDKALNRLNLALEIYGVYLFHTVEGVIVNYMPSLFKKKQLSDIGNRLSKSFAEVEAERELVQGMSVIFPHSAINAHLVSKDLYLIIGCKTFPLSEQITTRISKTIQVLRAIN